MANGTITKNGSALQFCSGTWINMSGSETDGSCSTNGLFSYDSTAGKKWYRWCDTSTWRVMRSVAATPTPGPTPSSTTYTTASTFAWQVPDGVTKITFEGWGGGGGGTTAVQGGGGGGGSYTLKYLNVTPGETLSVTVAAGGAVGANGGNSEISRSGTILAQATGGLTTGGFSAPNPAHFDVYYPGGTGAAAQSAGGARGGSSGGGGAGSAGAGLNGIQGVSASGRPGGAGGPPDGGAGGASGDSSAPGLPGTAPGGGGGGGGTSSVSAAGARGQVRISFGPVLTISATNLFMNIEAPATDSSWQTVTVTNNGGLPSSSLSTSLTGTYLQKGTDTCNGQTVAAGASCSVAVRAAGVSSNVSLTGTLTIGDGSTTSNLPIAGYRFDCSSATIGQTCGGTTALYAGVFDGGKYMIMPSGCANSTSNPTCSGNDVVTKTWNSGSTTYYDVPELTNITNFASASPSSERGHYNTPILAAITSAASGGVHAAAKHCADMVYGGFDDWYLPSKSELAYVYCKSAPSSHNTLYPRENPNCGGTAPTGQLTGFASTLYWSSSEHGNMYAHAQYFNSGDQQGLGKQVSGNYVRCVRRY